jgi:hypothetical protein
MPARGVHGLDTAHDSLGRPRRTLSPDALDETLTPRAGRA